MTLREQFTAELKTCNERIRSLAFRTKCHDIVTAAQTARGDFQARIRGGKDTLVLLRESVIRSERHLEKFRGKHRLDRPARYPRSRILRYGFLLVILLLEAMLNGLNAPVGALVIMDRGIATAANIAWLKGHGYRYLVVSRERERHFAESAADSITGAGGDTIRLVRELSEDGQEVRLHCHSVGRALKETGIPR